MVTVVKNQLLWGHFMLPLCKRPNTDLGFCDPSTHPVEIEEPDTSRLARGDRRSKTSSKEK